MKISGPFFCLDFDQSEISFEDQGTSIVRPAYPQTWPQQMWANFWAAAQEVAGCNPNAEPLA
jgi:hypothetical protein